MSYELIKDHTFINYTEGNSGREYIVIHYTGNDTDTAAGNANYFRNVYRGASAHYFVDNTTVYEVVAPEDTAWAVGVDFGGGKLFGVCNNFNSISIEMCSVNSRITDKTFNNTVQLTRKLMKKYGIPASRVVRHYDVCKKICPGWTGWTGSDTSEWKRFKKALTTEMIKLKKNAGGYARAEYDPVGGSVQRKAVIQKSTEVPWLKDDGCGWSLVKFRGKQVWVVNSKLNKSGLSKYPTVRLPKNKTLLRLSKDKSNFDKTVILKKERKFTILCEITEGKYKGFLYLKRNGKYYYCKA